MVDHSPALDADPDADLRTLGLQCPDPLPGETTSDHHGHVEPVGASGLRKELLCLLG